MSGALRILVVGDVMIDWIVRPEGPLAMGSDRRSSIVARPGGSAANQAMWLAHFGVAATLVGRVGEADHARLSQMFRRAGVETRLVADKERETGRIVVLVDPSGERSFLTDRGANDALTEEDVPDALAAEADLVHLSGYSFVAEAPRRAVRALLARARAVSVDPASSEFLREMGPANFLEWTRGAQMAFPNSDEAAVLTGAIDPAAQMAALAQAYPLVVVKRGAHGCEAAVGSQRWRVCAPRALAVDTTGAGDAFVAAFLAAKLGGAEIELCLERAAAAGAFAAERIGGAPPGRGA